MTVKLNLGCGTNRLPGWENHDADLDITKRLPFGDSSVAFIFIEHCVEHVGYYQAIAFFEDCRRVLAPGGVLRVTVPSVEQVWKSDDADYHALAAKWGRTPDQRGAVAAIVECHGHRTAWTASLMTATLRHAGFANVVECRPGQSDRLELVGVEGHGKVIGDRFNGIESICFEAATHAVERRVVAPAASAERATVAVIVGGAEGNLIEVEEARALCAEAGVAPEFYVVNDMIAHFPDPCVAASLHPDKLPAWLGQREKNNYSSPSEVWAHNRRSNHGFVTHTLRDRGGSSGLFATFVALEKGHDRVLLAGVPMDVARNHFVRKVRWVACAAFWRAWITNKKDLIRVRSFSGSTAELLGRPDIEFLMGEKTNAA